MKKIIFILVCIFKINAYSQVGIGTTTPNESAILQLESNNKGLLITRLTEEQKNAIELPANGLLIYQTDNDTGFYYYNGVTWVNIDNQTANEVGYNNGGSNLVATNVRDAINEVNSKITLYNVGDSHLGGIVYHTWDNGLHGLIVSPSEIRTTFWGNTSAGQRTYGTAQGLGSGHINTVLILSKHTTLNNAAAECFNLEVTRGGINYGGWYLPTVEELELMHSVIDVINPFLTNPIDNTGGKGYWSSCEDTRQQSHYVTFQVAGPVVSQANKAVLTINSRAIKQF